MFLIILLKFTPAQLVFDGERGTGLLGDIAIDDVVVTDSPCMNTTSAPPTDVTAVTTVTYREYQLV